MNGIGPIRTVSSLIQIAMINWCDSWRVATVSCPMVVRLVELLGKPPKRGVLTPQACLLVTWSDVGRSVDEGNRQTGKSAQHVNDVINCIYDQLRRWRIITGNYFPSISACSAAIIYMWISERNPQNEIMICTPLPNNVNYKPGQLVAPEQFIAGREGVRFINTQHGPIIPGARTDN